MVCLIQEIADPARFLDLTLDLRRDDPIGTNQIGSRAQATVAGSQPAQDSRFWIVQQGNAVVAVAMWTSLTGIYLSPTFSSSDALVFGKTVAKDFVDQLPQASGPVASIHSFNEGYCAVRNPPPTPQWKETLLVYVLETLNPHPAEGSLVQASDADSAILKAWVIEYCEALQYPPEIAEPFHKRSMDRKSLHVWKVGGRIVGFAGYNLPVVTEGETIFRVGPVFVTPQERRKGYASAMTGALSQHLQQQCQTPSRVMLFADAKNPASNKAYQNVGFVQHSQVGVYKFTN